VKRRDFVSSLAVTAAAWPLMARAQPPKRIPLIGFLGAESASGYRTHIEAFRAGLRDVGYVEGRNIAIEFRWAESKYDRLPELAAQLVRRNVDVLVTHGAPGTRAAKSATTTIPIVMASAGDAVATDIVRNLARPAGNITGSTFFALELIGKRLDMLKQAMPRIAEVAVLFNPDNPITRLVLPEFETAAKSLKLRLQLFPVREPGELEGILGAIAKKRVDALVVPEYSMFVASAGAISRLALEHRLPTMGFSEFAEAGGMLGYGYESAELFRRAAVFVDRILKGAKPGELPVERATKFQLIVNRKTARAIGVPLPDAFLLRADKVIE
jgi:putative ABC transport system substrate-binding protein